MKTKDGEEAFWIRIEDKQPNPQQRCYVICENHYQERFGGAMTDKTATFQTMAEYIPFKTVLYDDYMSEEFASGEFGDYDEEKDEYYTPEGWYEWQSTPDIHWKLDCKVTHWMPLFEKP
jgi:hypothetical protein